MRVEVAPCTEYSNNPGLVAKSLKDETQEVGTRIALHVYRLCDPLGMSKQTCSEGAWISMVGPECSIDFVNAIIVDERANLIRALMELRHRLQVQDGDDFLHVSICARFDKLLVEPFSG